MSPERGRPDFSAFGKRRPVTGGVESSSRRGSFARGWWGRALIDALEKVGDTGRLSRGRTYARAGQVVALDVAPGRVTGEVQGSQPAPFTAVLTLRVLDEEHTAELVEAIRATPGTLAALASGSVPQELAPLLLPDGGRELDFDCTCPDPGWPCKHVAAVAYLFAERVDRDPLTMLRVRGLDLDTLIGVVGGAEEEPHPVADHYGDSLRFENLPEVEFVAAPDDLDAMLLRKVLRAGVPDGAAVEPSVAAALRDLDECYRALGSGFRRRR